MLRSGINSTKYLARCFSTSNSQNSAVGFIGEKKIHYIVYLKSKVLSDITVVNIKHLKYAFVLL